MAGDFPCLSGTMEILPSGRQASLLSINFCSFFIRMRKKPLYLGLIPLFGQVQQEPVNGPLASNPIDLCGLQAKKGTTMATSSVCMTANLIPHSSRGSKPLMSNRIIRTSAESSIPSFCLSTDGCR